MGLDEIRIFRPVENTVCLWTIREHEVKGQSIPDYFQNHLSWVLLMLSRLKAVRLFKVKFSLNMRSACYIVLLHCFASLLFMLLLNASWGGQRGRRADGIDWIWLNCDVLWWKSFPQFSSFLPPLPIPLGSFIVALFIVYCKWNDQFLLV